MYIYNWATFTKQVLPPHWRDTFRERLLRSLLMPIENVYRRFMQYKRHNEGLMNINAQVVSLAWHLNLKFAEPGLKGIEIINKRREDYEQVPGEVEIHIAEMFHDRPYVITGVRAEVKKFLPLGVRFTIVKKNNIF